MSAPQSSAGPLMDWLGNDGLLPILEAMDDLVLVKGERSRLVWANRAFRDYYGMTNQELRDLVDAPHSDPDDTVQYVRDDHHVFTTGATFHARAEPITRSDGGISYFHTIKTPIRNGQGKVIGTLGVSRPAAVGSTEQGVRIRDDRKEALTRLRSLVANIPMALAMLDVKQRVISHSEEWASLFGHSGTSYVGEFYDSRLEARMPLLKELEEALKSGQRTQLSQRPLGSQESSEQALCDVHIQPWSLPSGQLGGTILLISDLTELHASERRLRAMADEITQFNYRVSHDLVAPMRTMSGLVDVIRDRLPQGDDPLLDGALERLKGTSSRMATMVYALLDLARMDAPAQSERIDLPALAEELLDARRQDVEAQGVEIRLNWEWRKLTSQRVRVQQVLENLISNAIKFRDPAEDTSWVRIRTGTSEGIPSLSVEDNGVGIAPEHTGRIFERFERGQSKVAGSGLGLYLVKRHLEQLGGSIRVLNHRKPTHFEVVLGEEAIAHE